MKKLYKEAGLESIQESEKRLYSKLENRKDHLAKVKNLLIFIFVVCIFAFIIFELIGFEQVW